MRTCAVALSETCSDVRDGHALVHKVTEGLELVGGMHVFPHDVLGQADFAGVGSFRDAARNQKRGLDVTGFGEPLQRLQPPASGDDGEFLAVFPDDKVLLQAVRLDARGQLVDAGLVLRLADVAFPGGQLVERDVRDVSHGLLLRLHYPFGLASDPPGAGAASHRKIGGDLQGEPSLPVDARKRPRMAGGKNARREMQTEKGSTSENGERGKKGLGQPGGGGRVPS